MRTTSPAPYYSDLLGADVQVHPGQTLVVPLNPGYEHAVLVMDGDCALDAQSLEERVLSTWERLAPKPASRVTTAAGCCSSADHHFQKRS